MVQVFMTPELLNNELRAVTSGKATARRDGRLEESANRIANSRRHSALAGCAGWGGSGWN